MRAGEKAEMGFWAAGKGAMGRLGFLGLGFGLSSSFFFFYSIFLFLVLTQTQTK